MNVNSDTNLAEDDSADLAEYAPVSKTFTGMKVTRIKCTNCHSIGHSTDRNLGHRREKEREYSKSDSHTTASTRQTAGSPRPTTGSGRNAPESPFSQRKFASPPEIPGQYQKLKAMEFPYCWGRIPRRWRKRSRKAKDLEGRKTILKEAG